MYTILYILCFVFNNNFLLDMIVNYENIVSKNNLIFVIKKYGYVY